MATCSPRQRGEASSEVQVGVGLAGKAVDARVAAATVGIDRPAERHPRRVRHLVDDRPRLYLEEGHAAEGGGIEGAGHGPALEQRGRRRLATAVGGSVVGPKLIPAHMEKLERAFAGVKYEFD